MPIQFLGNCSIKRVWCISHCTPVCSEAWGVKANSSPSFPHPMFSAQCHWTCLSLQTPSSSKSYREKGEKTGSVFVPFSSCSIFGCNSAFKAQGNPCHQQNLQLAPTLQRHEGPASSGLQFREASLSREKVYMAPGRRLELAL